ncbi:MAG TPA: hypothetical protein VKY65_04760 [Alphaproteobacteria bacterium]|nr:hypothetical protein [Alphaproteobacteria bacterium]
MRLGRIIGWLLLFGAVLVVANEAYAWLDKGSYHIIAAGELWYDLDRDSLNLMQAVIQRYIAPALWDDVMRPLLLLPAWLILGVPGLVLVLLGRWRQARRRTPRRFS